VVCVGKNKTKINHRFLHFVFVPASRDEYSGRNDICSLVATAGTTTAATTAATPASATTAGTLPGIGAGSLPLR
jgi:hypothetical protein